jgi:hypothetical protein
MLPTELISPTAVAASAWLIISVRIVQSVERYPARTLATFNKTTVTTTERPEMESRKYAVPPTNSG